MKNIDKVLNQLKNIKKNIESKNVNIKLNSDDVRFIEIKVGQYEQDLNMIKDSLDFNNKLNETDFKDIILHIHKFSTDINKLIC